MREETMPVIGMGFIVPGPVGLLGILENNARFGKFLVGIAPYVKVTLARTGRCPARSLKPRMLIGSVIYDQLGDDLETAAVRFLHELLEIGHAAVLGMDVVIVSYVITVVAHWRGVEG